MNVKLPYEELTSEQKAGLARREKLPRKLVRVMAEDKSDMVRMAVAEISSVLPVSIIRRLAKDSHPLVREVIAGRTDTSPAVLRRLAKEEMFGKEEVYNPRFPTWHWNYWGRKVCAHVGYAAVNNPNCPDDVVRKAEVDESQDSVDLGTPPVAV